MPALALNALLGRRIAPSRSAFCAKPARTWLFFIVQGSLGGDKGYDTAGAHLVQRLSDEVGGRTFFSGKTSSGNVRRKTLITHGHDFAKFLGYEVTIAKGEYNKMTKMGAARRVDNGKVLLYAL